MAGKVVHFKSPAAFRAWLAANHTQDAELWVGFYKRASGRGGISYAEALDEALCYGWIDGVRHAVDDASYAIRFTQRRTKSVWSLVNVRHVERLKKCGKMAEPGLRAFELREQHRTGITLLSRNAGALRPSTRNCFERTPPRGRTFHAKRPGTSVRRATG